MEPRGVLYTVGHGARPSSELIGLLRGAGVERLVDVRTAPASRKHPQFSRDALAASLEQAGIAYEWEKDLGGWRRPRPDSPNTALRSPSFRGYADHMRSRPFREALARVLERAARTPTAVMCAESVWWRCHRGILADAVLAAGWEVSHLLPGGRRERHRLNAAARLEHGEVVYDVRSGQETLPEGG